MNNNYAAPHTPIASAKRPRNPNRAMPTRLNTTPPRTATSSDSISTSTPNTSNITSTPSQFKSIPEASLSPMHPARPMHSHNSPCQSSQEHNKESLNDLNGDDAEDSSSSSTWGALFSPVLSFLGQPQPDTHVDGEEHVDDDSQQQNHLSPQKEGDDVATVAVHQDEIIYDKDGDVSMDHNSETECTLHSNGHITTGEHQIQQHEDSSHSQIVPSGASVVEDSASEDDYDDDSSEVEEEFNPYLFIKRLPIYSSVAPFEERIHLPPKDEDDPRQTLVLDLDETLVHCTVEPNTPNVDMVFPVVFHGMEYQVHVRKRPYLKEFLERVYKEFEVVVFTASQRVYADELLNRIDPGTCDYFCRTHRTYSMPYLVKIYDNHHV